MSVHKEVKVRNLIHQRGLLHVGSSRAADTDIGIVGQYTSSGTKFTGLFRDDGDGVWNLFDGLSTSPFTADAVNKDAPGFTLGTLALGHIQTNSLRSAIENGDITIAAKGTGKVLLTAPRTITAPTANEDVVNKNYVDAQVAQAVQGWVSKESVAARTTGALVVTAQGAGVGKTLTSDVNQSITNAASSFDSIELAQGDRVLVANQAYLPDNGIYVVTNIGSVDAPWVLTRSTDADESPTGELTRGAHVFVDDGTLYRSTGWVLQGPFETFDIDNATHGNQTWVKFSKDTAISFTAENKGAGHGIYSGMEGTQFQFNTLMASQIGGDPDMFKLDPLVNPDSLTYVFDQSKITGTGELVSGSIGLGFGPIYTSSAIRGVSLETAGQLTFSGATGQNIIDLRAGLADALSFKQGVNKYLTFDTTEFNERIVADKPIEAPSMIVADAVVAGGLIDANGGMDVAGGLRLEGGGIDFIASTGLNAVNLLANLADALSFKQGVNKYLTFDTTEFNERIVADKPIEALSMTVAGAVVAGGLIDANGGMDVAGGLRIENGSIEVMNGGIDFTAGTGLNAINLLAGLADALSIKQGVNKYLTFDTTEFNERIVADKPIEALSMTVTGSLTAGGLIDANGGMDVAGGLRIEGGGLEFTSGDGQNFLTFPGNQFSAFTLKSASDSLFTTFQTTTSEEKIIIHTPVETSSTLTVNGSLTANDPIYVNSGLTANGMEITTGGLIRTTFGEIEFANLSNNKITMPSNMSDALSVQAGDADKYITFDTTSGHVDVHKQLRALGAFNAEGPVTLYSGLSYRVETVGSNTQLDVQHHVVNVNTGEIDITLTLPPVAGHAGRTYKIAKADSGAGRVIITPDTIDLIDGENSSVVLDEQYTYTRLTCHGVLGWFLH
jgi:hypothetical protein